jgi:hypothetical protein
MENKYLKFEEDLVPLILSGKKTTTLRLFDDKDISEGDHLRLIDKDNGEEFARADVTMVYEKKFGDLNEDDLAGHEQYESFLHMREKFHQYYGERVNDETLVKIIRFRLV